MKIAVVGSGNWGKNHIRTLHELGLLGGVIEMSPDRCKLIKDEYPEIQVFQSLDQDGALNFDGYTLAVPAPVHYPIAKILLENGKHVLVEKPITLHSKNAKNLCDIAKENNAILMVGHLLLFHPAIIKIKECLKEGMIGKLQYIYSNRLNLGTVRTEENILWSFAPHDISIFQFLTESYPTQVTSNGGAFIQPKIFDSTLSVLYYPKNIIGHIFVSWLHPFKEHRLVVIGSKGMLVFEDTKEEDKLMFYEKGIDIIEGSPVKREGEARVVAYEAQQPLARELQHFADCIKGEAENNIIPGEMGLEVLKILEEASTSLQTPTHQGISAEKKRFFCHETAHIGNNVEIGDDTKIWNHTNVQSGAKLGKGCILGQNVNIGPNVKVGNKCKIQNNVSVYEGVELEDYVFCGPSMVFTNITNPRCKYPQAESKYYKKTKVKEGASIGANATIVCGVTIGKHAFIGAGAVVTQDVPDYALVYGNPAKQKGWVSEGGLPLTFSENEHQAYCEKSQKWYELKNQKLKEVSNPESDK